MGHERIARYLSLMQEKASWLSIHEEVSNPIYHACPQLPNRNSFDAM
jgi:hypothetical protein